MNPVEVLLRAKALLASQPLDLPALAELFDAAQPLLESELAAAWVVRHLPHAPLFAWLRHVDPLERRRALEFVSSLGSPGARFLRHLTKDSVNTVAVYARGAVRRLELRDVAPRDRDAEVLFGRGTPFEVGGWNPTGWNAGLWRHRRLQGRVRGAKTKGPTLGSPAALLQTLGLSEERLRELTRPVSGNSSGYIEFTIPKRRGTRTIAAPKQELKVAQRWLLDEVLSAFPLHDAAHGFRVERSVLTNARPHVGAGLVLKLDLQDFFPSVHFRRVEGLMRHVGYSQAVARLLARLTTYRPRLADGRAAWPGLLPQGAPTSPVIANLICRRLDARLTGLAAKFKATYTRYADDLTFSFREPHPQRLGRFLWWVNAIAQQEGFLENAAKRRFLRQGSRQQVTGLVVNERVSVPRHVRRRFKAIVHNVKRNGLAAEARGRPVAEFAAWLHGLAAYIAMVHPEPGKRWLAEVKACLASAAAEQPR